MHRRTAMRVAAVVGGATLLAALTGCTPFLTAGEERTEERDIEDASSVVLRTAGDIDIRLGDTPALTVTGGENVLDRLTTEVEGDRLLIAMQPGPLLIGDRDLDIEVTVTSLERVVIDGSGDVTADFGDAEDVLVEIGGSGRISADDLDASTVRASVSGSGNVELGGRTDALTVEVSGSGDIETSDLEASTAQVVVSGSGSVSVAAQDELDVTISGSGNVRYSGRPEIRSSISGSGELVPE